MMNNEQQKGYAYHNHVEHSAASGFVVERIGLYAWTSRLSGAVPGIMAGLAVGFSGLAAAIWKNTTVTGEMMYAPERLTDFCK